jgi:hypothetical protein
MPATANAYRAGIGAARIGAAAGGAATWRDTPGSAKDGCSGTSADTIEDALDAEGTSAASECDGLAAAYRDGIGGGGAGGGNAAADGGTTASAAAEEVAAGRLGGRRGDGSGGCGEVTACGTTASAESIEAAESEAAGELLSTAPDTDSESGAVALLLFSSGWRSGEILAGS